eukprot:TRINITY_DN7438_c0_g1_i4.p1 TRINITY_DN7438_c0_g1~~TRINITY_DN7438_c0_g1_i4.p1  ORF type:complete len:472 (+),score=40.74 TRINITY_DN7438_c0_g1_i4:76-1491(+)
MSLAGELPIEGKTIQQLCLRSLKRAREVFGKTKQTTNKAIQEAEQLKLAYKTKFEYGSAVDLPSPKRTKLENEDLQSQSLQNQNRKPGTDLVLANQTALNKVLNSIGDFEQPPMPLMVRTATGKEIEYTPSSMIQRRLASKWPKPEWHAPWVCYRVISGHLGWVRSIAFDPTNEWFCTGSADRTIKIWDTATGTLKLTLTGHIEQITGLAVSANHPYMFSCGLDKMIKCWDMEQNKVIRNYHGHLSGIYALQLHPTMDILMTGGRDSVCRVWDMRSKIQAHCLSGHDNTVSSIFAQEIDPQVATASHDCTIRLWDLRKGSTLATLTHHKKSVRSIVKHPNQQQFISASADNIKKYKLPNGEFIHNMLQHHRAIVNAVAVNEDNVFVSAGDNGSLNFWDWKSGNRFQEQQTVVQPGSLESEAGIYALSFDVTGSRLVTCEADKTIKMWKEDESATPETHPVKFVPPKGIKRY